MPFRVPYWTVRVLIFTNTPAHVHLYRNAVTELVDRGHDVLVLGRDDSHAKPLLEYYDLPHVIYGHRGPTKWSLARELPAQFVNITRLARRFDPDVIFGRGAYSAFAGVVTGAPVVLFFDSIPWRLGYVLPSKVADSVVTTNAFREDLGPKHHRFRGVTELAYLHPDVYTPDSSVREELGVDPDEPFALVRFNGFGAFHDIAETGFSRREARTLVTRLADHATVFVSDERDRMDLATLPDRVHRYDLHPARIHDVLAEARLFVADTGTMVTEAALLGTPTVRATLHDADTDLGEMRELESAGLVVNCPPADTADVAVDLLTDEAAPDRWRRARDEFVRSRVDPTALIVDLAERPEESGAIVDAHVADARAREALDPTDPVDGRLGPTT